MNGIKKLKIIKIPKEKVVTDKEIIVKIFLILLRARKLLCVALQNKSLLEIKDYITKTS
jgi:hypothetical protein